MSKRLVTAAGYVVFAICLFGAWLRGGQDDDVTAYLKAQGVYEPLMIGGVCLMVVLVAYIVKTVRATARLKRKLERLQAILRRQNERDVP